MSTTVIVPKTEWSLIDWDRALIEDDKLLIKDYDTIAELTTFIQKGNSFQAEDGCHDDLAMCLVIFAWMAMQEYFKEMHDNDVRQRIYDDQRDSDLSASGIDFDIGIAMPGLVP